MEGKNNTLDARQNERIARVEERIQTNKESIQALFKKVDEVPLRITDIIANKFTQFEHLEAQRRIMEEKWSTKTREEANDREKRLKTIERWKDKLTNWWFAIIFMIGIIVKIVDWLIKTLLSFGGN